MQYKWLNKNNNKEVVIFFNGWGMDNGVISHFSYADYDAVMFYDYNLPELDFDFEFFRKYEKRYLVSWSMGVMVATLLNGKCENIDKSVAINGTLKPIDAEYGINPKIYDLTIRGFNENGREKFIKSMFLEDTKINCSRDIENQKSELIAIKNYKADEEFIYDKVYISNSDKIIPTKSQENYWGKPSNIEGGHCIFNKFNSFMEIING